MRTTNLFEHGIADLMLNELKPTKLTYCPCCNTATLVFDYKQKHIHEHQYNPEAQCIYPNVLYFELKESK